MRFYCTAFLFELSWVCGSSNYSNSGLLLPLSPWNSLGYSVVDATDESGTDDADDEHDGILQWLHSVFFSVMPSVVQKQLLPTTKERTSPTSALL